MCKQKCCDTFMVLKKEELWHQLLVYLVQVLYCGVLFFCFYFLGQFLTELFQVFGHFSDIHRCNVLIMWIFRIIQQKSLQSILTIHQKPRNLNLIKLDSKKQVKKTFIRKWSHHRCNIIERTIQHYQIIFLSCIVHLWYLFQSRFKFIYYFCGVMTQREVIFYFSY